jgi:hypothetical protein
MAGPYDIEVIAVLENHNAMRAFVNDGLAGVTGISTVHVSVLLDIVKY